MQARCSTVAAFVNAPPSAAALRHAFDRAADVLAIVDHDPAVKSELPASRLELVTPPAPTVGEVAAALRASRHRLAAAVDGIGLLAAAGAHPFSAPEGELSAGERYEAIAREYGCIARRQLVFGLHVHVAVRPAVRALACAARCAHTSPSWPRRPPTRPFTPVRTPACESIRPKLAESLPRQGVPPAFASLEELAGALTGEPPRGR